jgi:hypothetical protein
MESKVRHIGFTGTRKGMTDAQKSKFLELMSGVARNVVLHLHHGDCLGADSDAHCIWVDRFYDCPITIHPPNNIATRGYCLCKGDGTILDPKPYLERNHDIVDACEILIACPAEPEEILRSGTWATVRYAKKIGKHVIVIKPDGCFSGALP